MYLTNFITKDGKYRFHKFIIILFIISNMMINDFSKLFFVFASDFLFDDIK